MFCLISARPLSRTPLHTFEGPFPSLKDYFHMYRVEADFADLIVKVVLVLYPTVLFF